MKKIEPQRPQKKIISAETQKVIAAVSREYRNHFDFADSAIRHINEMKPRTEADRIEQRESLQLFAGQRLAFGCALDILENITEQGTDFYIKSQ